MRPSEISITANVLKTRTIFKKNEYKYRNAYEYDFVIDLKKIKAQI